ncbi:hypothetical protein V8E51_014466 [Hyaloscypha variabilis]
MAVAMVTVFVLLMIFFALMIVWLVLSIYLSLKAKRNSRPPPFSPNLTAKQIQRRAALITFTFGLILLSKRFKAKQRRDFGPPEPEPGEGGGIYEHTDPQKTMHRKGGFGDRVRVFFGGKKTGEEAEMQVLSTGFTNFDGVDAPQLQVEEPVT